MSDEQGTPRRRGWLAAVPLLVVVALGVLLLARLFAGDPARIPSALIGKPAPTLTLPGADGRPGLTDADLRAGHVTVVNVFGSWCVPCRDEHPLLKALTASPAFAVAGARLVGVAQKDTPANVKKFFDELSNPYSAVGFDDSGRAGIDWGVYGVPETFIVDGKGMIAFKHIGPLAEGDVEKEILPAIAAAAMDKP